MMTAGKKIKSLFFIIAFLFITNIILLLFLLLSKNNNDTLHNGDVRSVVESFLEDSIGFDKKQMAIYQKLRKADFERRKPLIENMKSARNNFYENIYSDKNPDSVITRLATTFGESQMTVDKHMLQYFKNVRRICTEAQLPKFDSSFKSVVEKVNPGRSRKRSNH